MPITGKRWIQNAPTALHDERQEVLTVLGVIFLRGPCWGPVRPADKARGGQPRRATGAASGRLAFLSASKPTRDHGGDAQTSSNTTYTVYYQVHGNAEVPHNSSCAAWRGSAMCTGRAKAGPYLHRGTLGEACDDSSAYSTGHHRGNLEWCLSLHFSHTPQIHQTVPLGFSLSPRLTVVPC